MDTGSNPVGTAKYIYPPDQRMLYIKADRPTESGAAGALYIEHSLVKWVYILGSSEGIRTPVHRSKACDAGPLHYRTTKLNSVVVFVD